MSANSFGRHFQITSFGESHGTALGVVIEGCPAGVPFNEFLLKDALERRRPGSSSAVSARQEKDEPEILSGVFEGRTLGTPICVVVRNSDARSQDYQAIQAAPRAGHADDVWREKFGVSDHRGGGRSSGRETLARVIGGAFAQMFLQEAAKKSASPIMNANTLCTGSSTVQNSLHVQVVPTQIGPIQITNYSQQKPEIEKFLQGLKAEGESVGGVVEVQIQNPPKNLGQPVFHKLKSDLAAAFMSIGATTGVELGGGFALAEMKGTEVHRATKNEMSLASDKSGSPEVNPAYGGIRGGISTGETITLRIAFKPTSSILDVAKKGRHDPCIVLRAMPVVEAMTYLVLADHVLWSRLDQV